MKWRVNILAGKIEKIHFNNSQNAIIGNIDRTAESDFGRRENILHSATIDDSKAFFFVKNPISGLKNQFPQQINN